MSFSVHHTGTHFLADLLCRYSDGSRRLKPGNNSIGERPPENTYIHCHVEPAMREHLSYWMDKEYPIVIPIRHPVAVAKSWKSRGKNIQEMIAQWDVFLELVAPFKAYYLALDSPNRHECMKKIRTGIDDSFSTTWKVIASKNKTVDLTTDEYNAAETIYKHSFFQQFYD